MPKTKLENVIFTLMMAFVMVYAMICYNIALNVGGMSNQAFILEFFVVERLSRKLAFRLVTPGVDKPVFVILAISCMIVCLMCPMMSLVATILFKNPGSQIVAVWLQTAAMNFPMALCWQVFFAGPLVRLVFRVLFRRGEKAAVNA